jgi:hypothetical protein
MIDQLAGAWRRWTHQRDSTSERGSESIVRNHDDMTRTLSLVLVASLAGACSSTEEEEAKQRECDQIAEQIREAARARGLRSEGLCDKTKAPELAADCTRLSECNRQLAEL